MSILVDPLSVFMILVVTGVSTLIHLYSVSYMEGDRGFARYFSYLNFFVFSMLLLVLAGNFLLLIVGWAFVGAASYLLISFWYRRTTATRAGIKAFVINVVGDVGLVLGTYFIFRHTGSLEFLKVVPRDRRGSVRRRLEQRGSGGRLRAAPDRRLREVRADSAAHVAARRDGGPNARQRADPRRDDGDRGRVSDRAHASPLRACARRPGRGRDRRRSNAPDGGHRRPRADRRQACHRLLDDVPDRLHDHGRVRRRVCRRAVPPDDPRLLQGPAVHGGRDPSSARWRASSRSIGWEASDGCCRSPTARS